MSHPENRKEQAGVYKQYNVFPDKLIEGVIETLESYEDENLREKISGDREETMKLVRRFLHCG